MFGNDSNKLEMHTPKETKADQFRGMPATLLLRIYYDFVEDR